VLLARVSAALVGPSLPSTVHQHALIAAPATFVQRPRRPSVPRGHTPVLDRLSALSAWREATPSQAPHHACLVREDTTAPKVLSFLVPGDIGQTPLMPPSARSVKLDSSARLLLKLYVRTGTTHSKPRLAALLVRQGMLAREAERQFALAAHTLM
jgi:hypothetical protein